MLPGSIWQTFMTGALRGTQVEQFSPFVALGTPPGTATDESTDGTDENSDGNSDDEDKDKKNSDSDSSDSDHGSDGSSDSDRSGGSRGGDSESDSGSGSGSGGSGSADSSDEGAAFQEPRFTVPGLRNSQPVRQTSGQQPLAAGTPTAG
jgi:hypothetical protein